MRTLYRILSLLVTAKAASRGPGPLAKNYVRRSAHRGLARWMRKAKM